MLRNRDTKYEAVAKCIGRVGCKLLTIGRKCRSGAQPKKLTTNQFLIRITNQRKTNLNINLRRMAYFHQLPVRVVTLFLLFLLSASCAKNKEGGFSFPPMPVETAEVAKGRVADQFETVGTLEGANAITVVSQIDGLVVEIPFREGYLLEKEIGRAHV